MAASTRESNFLNTVPSAAKQAAEKLGSFEGFGLQAARKRKLLCFSFCHSRRESAFLDRWHVNSAATGASRFSVGMTERKAKARRVEQAAKNYGSVSGHNFSRAITASKLDRLLAAEELFLRSRCRRFHRDIHTQNAKGAREAPFAFCGWIVSTVSSSGRRSRTCCLWPVAWLQHPTRYCAGSRRIGVPDADVPWARCRSCTRSRR